MSFFASSEELFARPRSPDIKAMPLLASRAAPLPIGRRRMGADPTGVGNASATAIWHLIAPISGELGRRFRPIAMTTIGAALASLPLALGTSLVWNCGI